MTSISTALTAARSVVLRQSYDSKRNLVTIRWLLAHGVDVNAKRLMWDCNHTALHMTAESGAIDVARLLLEAGANPNILDDEFNSTALGWATFFDPSRSRGTSP